MAGPSGPQPPPTPRPKAVPPATSQNLGNESTHISRVEQRQKDWNIIKKLMVNIWPPNDWSVRGRVLLGFGLLVAGKARRYFRASFEW